MSKTHLAAGLDQSPVGENLHINYVSHFDENQMKGTAYLWKVLSDGVRSLNAGKEAIPAA